MPNAVKVQQVLTDVDFDLKLELVAGKAGLKRIITSDRVQKPGLALTGFVDHIHPSAAGYQIMAQTWFNAISKAYSKILSDF